MKKINHKQLAINHREKILTKIDDGGVSVFYNYKNWVKHEIYNENKALFPRMQKDTNYSLKFKLNYVYMENQQTVIDHIMKSIDTPIGQDEIWAVHEMLCENTDVVGGLMRYTNKRLPGLNILPPDYDRIPHKMATVYDYLADPDLPAISKALKVHFDIIAIQPFDDYNKRTARLIMNWVLIQQGFTPILFSRKNDRNTYLDALATRNRNRSAYDETMFARLLRTQEEVLKLLNKQI